uniref:Putative HNH homing endonuclease n=1 Tax=Oogamochlamys gigantea TaxID=158507 RepID=A0A0S2LNG7_9CHLO|nr:putative HNH homing endonuclease [Oogamochlamys gigantea]ALO62835.1 putative HNH homing endonuclease [Oogamochlamys gigantea]
MAIKGNLRLTDIQIKEKFKLLQEKQELPTSVRELAAILKTSENRLYKVLGKPIPGFDRSISAISDDQLLKALILYSQTHKKQTWTINRFSKEMGVKPSRVYPILEANKNLLESQPAFSVLRAASFETPLRNKNVNTINKMIKILRTHENPISPNLDNKQLYCEVCRASNFGSYSPEIILNIDHIYGKSYNNVEHLRVICRNCHCLTLNNRRRLVYIPNDFISNPPHDKTSINYQTENILKKLESIQPFVKRLEKQQPLSKTTLSVLEIQRKVEKTSKNNDIIDLLISQKVKNAECECCSAKTWLNLNISPFLELHHKNGNSKDQSLKNLEILCANCHNGMHFNIPTLTVSKTNTYKSSNNKKFSNIFLLIKEEKRLFLEHVQKNKKLNKKPLKGWSGWEQSLDIRKVFAILNSKNKPPHIAQCARLISVHEEKFIRIATALWPNKLSAAKQKKSTLWLGDIETARKAKIVYDVIIVQKQTNRSALVCTLGSDNNISSKTWITLENFLKENYYVKNNLNPFDFIFEINSLKIPTLIPQHEKKKKNKLISFCLFFF